MKTLIYILHSGQRYGTEKMALATLNHLKLIANTALFAPAGPVHPMATEQGITSHVFHNKFELARQIWPYLTQKDVCICTTGVSQALIVSLLALIKRQWFKQFHIVHGGTDERLSYGRKHCLQRLGIELVAVSDFVKSRLIANGCNAQGITVIENFLTGQQQSQRPAFVQAGIQRICMLTRIDPIKQVALAIDAWQLNPQLPALHICGSGWEREKLQAQSRYIKQIKWHGFVEYTSPILVKSDLYLHTCDCEPFGLAILEAMDAGVPVLVPDRGGAAALVENGKTGFYFRAGDSADLAAQIKHIQQLSAEQLNQIVANARQQLQHRFSAAERIADYARLCEIREVNHE